METLGQVAKRVIMEIREELRQDLLKLRERMAGDEAHECAHTMVDDLDAIIAKVTPS